MTRVALKGISSRRMRTALTMFAIVLGVAMVAGAYTLTDTMRGASDSLSEAAYDGTTGVVSAKTAFDLKNDDELGARPTIPASTLDEVRTCPAWRTPLAASPTRPGSWARTATWSAAGRTSARARPATAGELTPFRLKEGRFATASGEAVIDAGTADKEGYGVGDEITVQGRGPERTLRVTGIATFGEVDSIGTATFVLMDLPAAQDMFQKQGRYDEVLVAGDDSVRAALRSALPGSLAVQTAADHDRFTLDGLNEFVVIRVFLLVFGGVAVFVGAFTIYNTLSITVAQRSRELALLRALGASRRQVLRSVLTESLVIGTVASLIGLGVGLLLAKGLSSVFAASGVELPETGTVFAARTIIVSLAVGIIVTRRSGLSPAMRATRVSPVTAMREGAEIPQGRIGRRSRLDRGGRRDPGRDRARIRALRPRHRRDRPPGAARSRRAAAVHRGGRGVVADRARARVRARQAGREDRRRRRGAGSPQRHAQPRQDRRHGSGPDDRDRAGGVLGRARRGHARVHEGRARGPGALATTCSWARTAGRPSTPAPTSAAAAVPGVKVATGLAQDEGRAFGESIAVDGVDEKALPQVFGWEWKDGSDASLAGLTGGGAVVTDRFADDHDLGNGDRFAVTAPGGKRLDLRVVGVSAPDRFNPLGLGQVTISRDELRRRVQREARAAGVRGRGRGVRGPRWTRRSPGSPT